MIPAALRKLLASRDRDLLDQPDPDLDVAEAIEVIGASRRGAVGVSFI